MDKFKTINSINLKGNTYSIHDSRVESIIDKLQELERKYKVDFIELKCKNCGGKIQQKYEDNIIKCPYCKSVYAVGIRQVNDKGEKRI